MSRSFEKVHETLPVFKIDRRDITILFVPGYFLTLKRTSTSNILSRLANTDAIEPIETKNIFKHLLIKANEAVLNWENQMKMPFTPESLTLHCGSDCNLNCSYCYSKRTPNGKSGTGGFSDIQEIEILAHHAAEAVKQTTGKLTLVYHGSGEPTLHWKQLTDIHKLVTNIANHYGIELFSYLATNGCFTLEQAKWLARNIDLVGISCDGPDDIQRMNRYHGKNKYFPLPLICSAISESGGQFDIRVTVTRETCCRQEEIVKYLTEDCYAVNIRVEPVYLAGKSGFREEDALPFYNQFVSARNYALKKGAHYIYSGVRMEEQHGPYCDVIRNNLRLTNSHVSANCFAFKGDWEDDATGHYHTDLKVFKSSPGIFDLKQAAMRIPDECMSCINIFHCSRGCPDFCIYEIDRKRADCLNPFRCNLHQLLTVNNIIALAETRVQ